MVNNEIKITDELIARYLSGEATPEEAIALHEWQHDPVNRVYFEKLQSAWRRTFPRQTRRIDMEKAWNEVTHHPEKDISQTEKNTDRFKIGNEWLSIAASILIIIGMGVIFYFAGNNNRSQPLMAVETTSTLKQIILPDRSKVTLNRNSSLSYPENFDSDQRAVQFNSGEAFFSVSHNNSKPFIIHTALANIRVVGTSFNVIVSANSLQVSVDEGKVLVYTSEDSTYLEPGFTATFNRGNPSLSLNRTPNPNDWAYATHKFVFHDAPLSDVFRSIEKAQLCSIKLGNKAIGNCKLTATFESVSTDYILNLITEALNLSVTKDDNTFTVAGEGCP